MGEVYRATDTKLKREVALKILTPRLAADPDRLARLHREAEVLASLNHPHIAAIYGLEDGGSATALVMELVEGPTLEERIARGPIPIDEVVAIAKPIAEAMEAAHERGIIHRDLKPANIKIRADGTVKVLDFGLAKLVGAARLTSAPATPTEAPTLSPVVTGIGAVLGTAAYMSPEQARGGVADKRSDVFAFGCILFEMVTGKRAFAGTNVSDTLANVAVMEPDWELLPAQVPLPVARLLRACVEKDRRRRVADFSTVLFVLMHELGPGNANPGTLAAAAAPSRRANIVAAAVAVLAAAAGLAVWVTPRPPPLRVARVTITSPTDSPVTVSGDRSLAISPDGGRIAYIGGNGTEILLRTLDRLELSRIQGLGNPRGVFFAPDGLAVGFFDASASLRTVPITGGASTLVIRADGLPSGATWGADGSIVFATGNPSTGLQRIHATGGDPIILTRPNHDLGEGDHRWPEFLPGGRFVLFTIVPAAGGIANARVAVLDLDTSTQTVLIRGGSHARYVSSGHLVYAAAGALWATTFDLKRLAVAGTPTQVLSPIVVSAAGAADFDVARDGTLVYVAGEGSAVKRALVWVDRQGREEPINAPPRAYLAPRISPDGSRVAIDVRDQDGDIWIWDFKRQALSRATFSAAADRYPVWTADGQGLLFVSDRSDAGSVFIQPSDGTREPERLTSAMNPQAPTAVSPDGTSVVFHELGRSTDLMIFTLNSPRTVQPLLQTRFAEQNGVISSDSRWLAYQSDESGQVEIHVRPFRDPSSGHWQVSTEGGVRPAWARNGRELFFLTLKGALMSVSIGDEATFSPGPPARAIDAKYDFGNVGSPRTYDVSPDGQRFLMIKAVEDTTTSASVIMVQNWTEELKRLVPAN